jgi:ribosomal protein L37E
MMTPDEYEQLAAKFLRKLAAADMEAWRAHWRAAERHHDDHALSSKQAETIETGNARHPRFISEARDAAKAAFATKYVREHPCKRCGGNIFYTSTGGCTACVRNFRKSRERPNEKEQRPCT